MTSNAIRGKKWVLTVRRTPNSVEGSTFQQVQKGSNRWSWTRSGLHYGTITGVLRTEEELQHISRNSGSLYFIRVHETESYQPSNGVLWRWSIVC